MENDEPAITYMARVMYEMLGTVILDSLRVGWDELTSVQRLEFETAAARAHVAYHDQYEHLAERSWR
jgi:hypothetical protein